MDYEKKLAQLEETVKKLEDGGITLEESVALFEKGVAITKDCLTALSEYKGKITTIQGEVDKLFEENE